MRKGSHNLCCIYATACVPVRAAVLRCSIRRCVALQQHAAPHAEAILTKIKGVGGKFKFG